MNKHRTDTDLDYAKARREIEEELEREHMEAVVKQEMERRRAGLAALIGDAKGPEGPAKVAAFKRLKVFGTVSDPELATKLALMSRKERRAYIARQKQAAGQARARKLGGAGKKKERAR